MATSTQYNPRPDLNHILLDAGASKTVYALVTPETESAKDALLGNRGSATRNAYLDLFREAWTSKQDALHEEFFDGWHRWSQPVVDLDRSRFPFYYPCNGASEPIRHLIFKWAVDNSLYVAGDPQPIHFFKGEYEGYKAMAEAALTGWTEHNREDWRNIPTSFIGGERFFISAPSAIDGNVWEDFNAFLQAMPPRTVAVDCTYVGAVPEIAIKERFNLNADSVHSIIFSLSKPFGVYYDRIGGIFTRKEDPGLFGNKWFKNLTSLKLGTTLMEKHDVFSLPHQYAEMQRLATASASQGLGFDFSPSDVFLLANSDDQADTPMANYLRRAGKLRICVTPGIAEIIGSSPR